MFPVEMILVSRLLLTGVPTNMEEKGVFFSRLVPTVCHFSRQMNSQTVLSSIQRFLLQVCLLNQLRAPPKRSYQAQGMTILTSRQKEVVDAVRGGGNLRVLAHAGAGKTQTLLSSLDEKETLYLTYNRDLKIDAKRRADVLLPEAVKDKVFITNFHGFLYNFYDRRCATEDFDLSMRRVIREDSPPLEVKTFARVIVDEAQDMTADISEFTMKIVADMCRPDVQLVLVGDPKQCIYGHIGASERFLMAPWEHRQFTTIEMEETFRFGCALARQVQDITRRLFPQSWWTKDLTSRQEVEGELVIFSHCRGLKAVTKKVVSAFKACQTGALLATTLNEAPGGLVWPMVHILRSQGLQASREEGSHIEVRTIHTSKGKEYDVVLLVLDQRFGLEHDRQMYGTSTPKSTLIYVAMTRARHKLIILQNDYEAAIDWITGPNVPLSILCAEVGCPLRTYTRKETPAAKMTMSSTDMLKSIIRKVTVEMKERIVCNNLVEAEALSPLDRLRDTLPWLAQLAISLRLCHDIGCTLPGIAPLISEKENGPQAMHEALVHGRYLPEYDERLSAIAKHKWDWYTWHAAASFLPSENYGLAHGAICPNENMCETAFQYAKRVLEAHHASTIKPEDVNDLISAYTPWPVFVSGDTLLFVSFTEEEVTAENKIATCLLAEASGLSRAIIIAALRSKCSRVTFSKDWEEVARSMKGRKVRLVN